MTTPRILVVTRREGALPPSLSHPTTPCSDAVTRCPPPPQYFTGVRPHSPDKKFTRNRSAGTGPCTSAVPWVDATDSIASFTY